VETRGITHARLETLARTVERANQTVMDTNVTAILATKEATANKTWMNVQLQSPAKMVQRAAILEEDTPVHVREDSLAKTVIKFTFHLNAKAPLMW